MADFKYWAFLSYSHQDNLETRHDGTRGHVRWAEWLHDSLETYKVPIEFRSRQTRTGEEMPDHFYPVFQDEKELPINADLGEMIRTALRESRFLIVICSPRSATSRYVNEEVRYFKELGRKNRIMTLMTDGEPNVSFGNKAGFLPAEECFCAALRHSLDANNQVDVAQTDAEEPIAGDVRIKDSASMREAGVQDLSVHRPVLEYMKLKLLAGLMGVGFDELAQRDKERQLREERAKARRLRRLVTAFALLAIIASAAGVVAFQQKKKARKAQARAESEKNRAESALVKTRETLSQSDFLQALRSIDEGRSWDALAQLARSLSFSPNNQAAACRLITLLSYRNFALPLESFPSKGPVHYARVNLDATTRAAASAILGKAAALLEKHNESAVQTEAPGEMLTADFSPDRKQILMLSQSRVGQIWDAKTGKPLAEPFAGAEEVVFSPDGQKVATISGNAARIWNPRTGTPLTEPLSHDSDVICVAFSSDGKRLLTGSVKGTARVWNTESGKSIVGPLKHEGRYVRSVQFSFDGKRILTAGDDATARVWNAQNGQSLLTPLSHDAQVHLARFSSDGKRIVTASQDGMVRVWDAENGSALTAPLWHDGPVRFVEFSPDTTRIVTGTGNKSVQIWDLRSGKPLSAKLTHSRAINSAQFSPNGQLIVTASSDETARIWNAQSGTPFSEPMKHDRPVALASFGADGSRIITLTSDGTTRVWNARYGTALTESLKHESAVESAQFSRDGQTILTVTRNGSARVWNAEDGGLRRTLASADRSGESVYFGPVGQKLVVISENEARIYDTWTGRPIGKPLIHQSQVTSAQFSQDETRLVTGSDDGTARIWDLQTGKTVGNGLSQENPLYLARFSVDGNRVVTAAHDKKGTAIEVESKKVRVWDIGSEKLITQPLQQGYNVTAAQFTTDGRRLMTFGSTILGPAPMKIWDLPSGHSLVDLNEVAIWSARFAADGKRFVTALANKTARIWDTESGKPLTEPMAHGDEVTSAQFSSDGGRLVTASDDYTARVWDPESGKPLSDYLTHEAPVKAADFSPDGTRIVTVSDTVAKIWEIAPVMRTAPSWLLRLAEAAANQHLNERSFFEPLSAKSEDVLDQIRNELANASTDDDAVIWGRWFLADRATRTISPHSKVTLADYIRSRIQEKTPQSINEVEQLAVGDSKLWQ